MTFGLLCEDLPQCARQTDRSASAWQALGSLRALYCRVPKLAEPIAVSEVQALENYGLVGDRHASLRSPRQLLVADQETYEHFNLPPTALRENLLVDFATEPLRSGQLLTVGPEVVLWLTFHCEPCNLLERRRPGTVKRIGKRRGMLARVVRGGMMRCGDTIRLAESSLPAMSDDWQARVLRVACAVPKGQCISYRQLAELAGVATAYCRAFPRVLARLPQDVADRVRSTSTVPSTSLWDGSALFPVAPTLEHRPSEHSERASISSEATAA